MMNKTLKRILIIAAVLLIVFFSLNIKNLEEYKSANHPTQFDAKEFASKFWENDLPATIDQSPEVTRLLMALEENPEEAFAHYGNKLGISRTGYFFVKGKGRVESVEEEYILLSAEEGITLKLATEYIFGNAVRDGSGRVDINEFLNMTDFNRTSVEINRLIKEKVIPRLTNMAQPGRMLEFAGAVEIPEENPVTDSLRIIPVKINPLNGGE